MAKNWKKIGSVMMAQGTRTPYKPPYERRPAKNYTPVAEPIAQLYVCTKWYAPYKVCAYHSGMKGHTIDVCKALKDKIQMLIHTKAIQLKDPAPNVVKNPLPNHQVNMVEVDDTSDWEKSIWVLELEESMIVTAQTPMIVQRRDSFEVEVAMPKPHSASLELLFLPNLIPMLSHGIMERERRKWKKQTLQQE
ncbi:hypothetical protein KY285_036243 [Solanum tuberosum]|nr:hypothetical protein KY285_036243 [Solanum tuberosum]